MSVATAALSDTSCGIPVELLRERLLAARAAGGGAKISRQKPKSNLISDSFFRIAEERVCQPSQFSNFCVVPKLEIEVDRVLLFQSYTHILLQPIYILYLFHLDV